MDETTFCNVCDKSKSIADTDDLERVRSNVREFGNEKFTVWRCENCGSLHSKEAIDLNRYYYCYPARKQRFDIFSRIAFRNRLAILRRLGLNKRQSILDYGCGSGIFVNYLENHGFRASGYDPYSETYSDRTRLKIGFDAVMSQDVIEHVLDPYAMLEECAELLVKDGLLFIGCPNAAEIDLKRKDEYFLELHQPFHRHILSEQALLALCAKAGFKPLKKSRRLYADTWIPFNNRCFLVAYLRKTGGFVDAIFEDPAYKLVMSSPRLLFFGLFGRFAPSLGNMVWVFQKIRFSSAV